MPCTETHTHTHTHTSHIHTTHIYKHTPYKHTQCQTFMHAHVYTHKPLHDKTSCRQDAQFGTHACTPTKIHALTNLFFYFLCQYLYCDLYFVLDHENE